MKIPDPYMTDDENPEWTEEMFREARPAREVLTELFGAEATERFLAESRRHLAARAAAKAAGQGVGRPAAHS